MAIKVNNTTVIDDNRKIIDRVSTTASASSLTPNSDTVGTYIYTALAAGLTIAADSGSPFDGQKLIFRFKDNGTARALNFTTGVSKGFRALGPDIPTTTLVGKVTYVGCIYNSGDARWDVVAVAEEA